MKVEEFLINEIKGWCSRHKELKVKYAYEESTAYHLIEVLPEELVNKDDSFRKEVFNTWSAFMEKFPESDLLISEPDPSNDMSNLLFEN